MQERGASYFSSVRYCTWSYFLSVLTCRHFAAEFLISEPGYSGAAFP